MISELERTSLGWLCWFLRGGTSLQPVRTLPTGAMATTSSNINPTVMRALQVMGSNTDQRVLDFGTLSSACCCLKSFLYLIFNGIWWTFACQQFPSETGYLHSLGRTFQPSAPWDVNFEDKRLYYQPLWNRKGHGTYKGKKQHLQAEYYDNENFPAAIILKGSAWLLPFPVQAHAEMWCLKLPEISRWISKVLIINCSKQAGKQTCPKGGFPAQFWNWFSSSSKTCANF